MFNVKQKLQKPILQSLGFTPLNLRLANQLLHDIDGMFQDWGDGVKHHFHQYFSYIVVVSFIGEETGVPEENHQPVASH